MTSWYVDPDEPETRGGDSSLSLTEYHVTASPNDFNVRTIYDFMKEGVIRIPPFQRNYVWDVKRASRLIESLVMGLPIPQIFLYEKSRNEWQVIDGQQRLLTIYFFLEGRFPKKEARADLRKQLRSEAIVPPELLANEDLFSAFELVLPLETPDQTHPLEGKSISTLDDDETQLNLRTIRIVIVKQSSPKGDDSIYEIFNRLNSGGINLTAQEIRFSLYHCEFLTMLTERNSDPRWRRLLGQREADVHFRDVEFLLRGVALLASGGHYRPSMARFLNAFAHKGEGFGKARVEYFDKLIDSFFAACEDLPRDAFFGQQKKFTVSIFDAVFAAWCAQAYQAKSTKVRPLPAKRLRKLKRNQKFVAVAQARTTGAGNVRDRVSIASRILKD